ncbi:molybdopterin-dependent oxidoreductase [Nocardia colli]|uniref:Molybdopterin-dependent oxidoreductase n=1 Tax=Nocardia colli TaxID=2545717 RepID=A0A5N0EHU7_9NOCA|nr:molybdopterin-dependent oxidoreductase [Nocardia colli]KAA8888189.1 molybdopterin-dependent oxidoreductase [Nocardia colli]
MADLRSRVAAGIVSAAVTLGVAELLAAFFGPDSAPLNALGATVVDHTPDGVREWAISTFGTSDKTVLYICMALVAVVVAGLAGALERTSRTAGSTILAIFGVVATIVTVGRTSLSGALPTIVGVAVGIYALRVLTRRIDAVVETTERAEEQHSATAVRPAGETDSATTESAAAPETRSTTTDSPAASTVPADKAAHVGAAATSGGIADSATSNETAPTAAPAISGSIADSTTAGRTEPASSIAISDSASAGREVAAPERRRVLQGLAIVGGLAVVTGVGGKVLGLRRRDVSGERAAVELPQPVAPEVPIAPGADLRVPGLTPYLTSNADFYRIDTALIVPQLSKDDWSLRIHGMVDREIRLSWADLANRPVLERLVTLACVSNPVGGDLIGNARWLGYRLDELLAEAGPHPDADMVLSRSIDGFTAGSPLSVLTDGRDAMLAVGMNGEPLPVAHGYPARLVVPGLYGYVSATKWVTELEVTRFDRATAYWTRRGWSALGPIKTGTRIDTPRGRGRIKQGRTTIAGVAWAQHRGIRAVEVQIDNGNWQPARLADEQSLDTWRQWTFDWDATPGPHTLRARSTDGPGDVQTADRADVVPDGATGYPSVTIQVG